jgi:hypothetical protein
LLKDISLIVEGGGGELSKDEWVLSEGGEEGNEEINHQVKSDLIQSRRDDIIALNPTINPQP